MTSAAATADLRTQVAIVGAGPAGLLLSHLLAAEGVESVVVETRSEAYVAGRIRAGILEQSTVDLLRSAGLGDRIARDGHEHRGIHLQWPHERHHLDFVDLTGRSVFVYGQTEVQKDLVAARRAAGQPVHYEVSDTALHDVETERPSVTFTDASGAARRLVADVVVGCDGSFGPSRAALPRGGAAYVGEDLSLLVAGHPRRRRPVDRRADLRLAPRRLRHALDAVRHGVAGSTSRCPTAPTSGPGPTTGSGRRSRPGSGTARTAGS